METTTIKAKIHLLPPEKGGRKRGIISGYRPRLYFGITRPFFAKFSSDCGIQLDQEILLPNEEAEATITILSPQNLDDILLSKGIIFDIREGERTIGNGQIILGQERYLEKNTLSKTNS
jgi:elongation factor Tu